MAIDGFRKARTCFEVSLKPLPTPHNFNEAVVETFQFDILNRLTQYAIAGGLTKNVTYAYSTSKPHQLASIAGTINTTYAYDANGNTLAGNGRTYTWNFFNNDNHQLLHQ